MAQKKAHEVDAWLARPDAGIRVILIYGPDRGLVAERARRCAEQTGLPLDDPFSVVRLDAADIEQQPGRLIDEARTVPMFADRRLVWLRGAGTQKAIATEVESLSTDPPPDSLVLIEAGELRKTAALRTAVEKAGQAMALPCYADDARGVESVIDDELARAGLTIGLEARRLLKASLGGDRLATRRELEKLALYCADKTEVAIDDIRDAIGDVSGLAADDAVDAVLAGDLGGFDRAYSRLLAAGTPPFLVLNAAMRRLHTLQILRQAMDTGGKSASAVVAAARPPIFFARRKGVETALERWKAPALASALGRIQAAVLKTRQVPEVTSEITRQALLALTVQGARAGR